jgi:peptidoglycan/LPS O-acetylase OafA/YrhL
VTVAKATPTASGSGNGAFRPDIEGLRAVAVLLVLAYHARLAPLAGGFVGVDVFFVLSGFLITGLLMRELTETGTVSLPAFYARRARRLLPAALLVIAVTVAASAAVLPPLRVPDVSLDGAASALYVGNIRFAIQATDYLQAEFDPSPLLHYWSLGVEEQFYLFWPALLLIVARVGGTGRLWIGGVVVAIGVVSLAVSLALTETNTPLAFFLLPARAWELALGALVFLLGARLASMPAAAAALSGGAGIVLIVGGAMVITTSTPFPGLAALLPTVGAALVIAGGLTRPLAWPSRVLATAPARWFGRISYSLYLWHWPILVLPVAALGEELPIAARVALAVIAIPIAALTQRFIEDPIRRGRLTGMRTGRSLALAGVASVIVATSAMGLGQTSPVPGAGVASGGQEPELVLPSGPASTPVESGDVRPPSLPPTPAGPVPADLIPPLGDARADLAAVQRDGCHAEATDVAVRPCTYGDLNAATTVVLFGDSHAAQWFPAVERLAGERHWRLVSLTKGSCPAANVAVWSERFKRPFTECDEWRAAALERIRAERPVLVFVSNTRNLLLDVGGGEAVQSQTREDLWATGLDEMLSRLRGLATEVVLIADTPNPRNDPPVCLSAHLDDRLACATPAGQAISPARLALEARVASAAGVTFVDPTPWICPTDPCPVVIDRWLVYRDGGHIATAFSRALAPYLERSLPLLP